LVYVGQHAIRNIIPSLLSSPNYNIVGIYFRNLNKEKRKNFKMFKLYTDYSEVLQDRDLDCIYISSPNSSHFELSLKALKNNKHVICEKPLATNFRDISKLLKQAINVKKFIFEAFMFQYHDQFIQLQSLLKKKKKIGKIYSLRTRFGYPHLNKKNIRYKKNLGGGSFFDCACYLIKTTHILLGDNIKKIDGKIPFERKFEVDTGGSCLINFKNGQSAFLDWGIGRAYVNELDLWTEKYKIRAERIFSKSKDIKTKINIIKSNGIQRNINIKNMNHFEAMFKKFYQIINKNELTKHLKQIENYQKFYFTVFKSLN